MRIAIAGTGHLGTSLLRSLLASNHEVVAVLQDGRRNGLFSRWLRPRLGRFVGGASSMAGRARAAGIPVLWINKMTPAELAPLSRLQPDILLVGGFSIILKKPLLELPKIACVNTHSSLLPRHRGPNPFYAAIRAGDSESGVTFHVMDEGIDTGGILAQVRFPLGATDNVLTVYHKSCAVAAEHVVGVLDRIAREGIKTVPQDESKANYVKRPTIDDVWLDWEEPAIVLDRLVRACAPSPMPRFRYRGRTIYVARTEYNDEPVEAPPGTVLSSRYLTRIATGRGTLILRVAYQKFPLWLWPPFWHRLRPGQRLER